MGEKMKDSEQILLFSFVGGGTFYWKTLKTARG